MNKTSEHTMSRGENRQAFVLDHFSIDYPRPLKVIIIGAGFSGIAAGIRFLQRVKNVELTIYDKNDGIGGVWWSNRYPGLACDIPSHCYQYTFYRNTQWSAAYASGTEIQAYLEDVVATYQLGPYIKLQHEMICAKWDDDQGKWQLRIKNLGGSDEAIFDDSADVLFTGVGALSRWNWPDIEGLHDFKGTLVHSAGWDVGKNSSSTSELDESVVTSEDASNIKADGLKRPSGAWQDDVKDWGNKKVAVIGLGSSAIQIVAALQPFVGKLFNYARGQTWLSVPFASDKMAELLGRAPQSGNYAFTPEEKEAFKDPAYYKYFCHTVETEMNAVYHGTLRNTDMQRAAKEAFKANMIRRLAKKPWIADHLIPEFGVSCRRLTPGPGYLEALCENNVDFVPTHIKKVTPNGIETLDGQHENLDVIICATGYDVTFRYPFPIIGRDGVDIRDKWSEHPRTYLSTCVDGFPNWFFSMGPNAAVGSGSLLILIEYQIEYAVAAALKIQREGLKSMEPKSEAVDDYDEYMEHYFPTTVHSEKCKSWYKGGKEEGRVVGLWPGSSLHAAVTLKHPRWEDFNYERLGGQRNRMHWLGNGMTYNEETVSGDRAWYLSDNALDIPPIPSLPSAVLSKVTIQAVPTPQLAGLGLWGWLRKAVGLAMQ